MCAFFKTYPKESHATAAKRVMRYLSNTLLMGLWYSKGTNSALFQNYNYNFVDYKLDRKSNNGTCDFIGNSLVSWHSKK